MLLGKSERDKDETSVASVAVARDGKLLWLRRRDTGLWTLPGGHLTPGEEPLNGAIRELYEETGLIPAENQIHFIGDDLVPTKNIRVFAFVANIPDGEPSFANDPDQEASEFAWFATPPPEELVHVPHADNVTLRFLDPNSDLMKSDLQKEWRSKDGLRLPHWSNPRRAAWDKAYLDKLVEYYGGGDKNRLIPLQLPVTASTSGHYMPVKPVGARGRDRRPFYARMLAGGDRVPPIVVRRNGTGWHILDGNARMDAAIQQKVPYLDALELVDSSLNKAVKPEDMGVILNSSDPAGRHLVDHKPDLASHPPGIQSEVENYRKEILDSPKVQKRKTPRALPELHGVTRKVVYSTGGKEPEARSNYMVKPYHEKSIKRCFSRVKYPIQGWAEMTNQALYHAAGIGHLHQKVHVSEHPMKNKTESIQDPALVIHMQPGFKAQNWAHRPPKDVSDTRKIGVMDFLTNNVDRHQGNLMFDEDGNALAVDHSRSFQYLMNGKQRWRHDEPEVPKHIGMTDRLKDYIGSAAVGKADPYFNGLYPHQAPSYDNEMKMLNEWAPIMEEWWPKARNNVVATLTNRLQQIKDPAVRAHIQRNFMSRVEHLDDLAKFGVANHGTDWYRHEVPMYRPDEKSDAELEEERRQAAVAKWNQENPS